MKKLIIFIKLFIAASSLSAQENELTKANEYYRQGQYDVAEIYYRAALEDDEDNKVAKYNLANSLIKQNKYKEATAILTQLAASDADKDFRSSAHYNKGVVHSKLKDLEASIVAYKNALRLNPNDQQARENLQKALQEQKKQQQSQSQSQQNQSDLNQNQADQKLKQLQEKEKQAQQRHQKNQQGQGMSKDW